MNKQTISSNIVGSFTKSMNTESHSAVIKEDVEGALKLVKGEEIEGAICVVQNGKGEILGGVSLHDDERKGKVVFVGGTIDKGEEYLHTAKRKLEEESGIKTVNFTKKIGIGELPNHIFVFGTTTQEELIPNEEFSSMKWYLPKDFYEATIPSNQKILKMLNIVKDEE